MNFFIGFIIYIIGLAIGIFVGYRWKTKDSVENVTPVILALPADNTQYFVQKRVHKGLKTYLVKVPVTVFWRTTTHMLIGLPGGKTAFLPKTKIGACP